MPDRSVAWVKEYGGPQEDYFMHGDVLDGQGFANTGWYGGDAWLARFDMTGDTLWTRTYGGTGTDRGYKLVETEDGGFIIAGWTNSFGAGGDDIYIVKTDCRGNTRGPVRQLD